MEVPGPLVSSKPGETSVKWQLCYDMTAKMWWMVSEEAPAIAGQGMRQVSSQSVTCIYWWILLYVDTALMYL